MPWRMGRNRPWPPRLSYSRSPPMRPVKVSFNAVGFTQWVPIDYIESYFAVGIACIPSEDWSGTYTVQETFDDPIIDAQMNYSNVSISRTTTVATVTDAGLYGLGHGLTTADNVIVKGTGSSNLD